MAIVDPGIEDYLRRMLPEREPVIREMEELAKRRDFPIVGPLVGGVLFLLARSITARTVFECGSGYGYSALWFARALPEGGRVILTDSDGGNCAAARDYLARAGLENRADVRQGDGLALLEAESGPFDIIFCDIDKKDYPKIYPLLGPRLHDGGLFICDNMLWFGRVAREDQQDEDTRGVRELTRLLYDDPQLHTTILPLRDGVSVSLKL